MKSLVMLFATIILFLTGCTSGAQKTTENDKPNDAYEQEIHSNEAYKVVHVTLPCTLGIPRVLVQIPTTNHSLSEVFESVPASMANDSIPTVDF